MGSIARLIDANYYHLDEKREIFVEAEESGEKFMQELITMMVKETPKKDLFGEKDHSRCLTLFLAIFQHRYTSLYLEWLQIL